MPQFLEADMGTSGVWSLKEVLALATDADVGDSSRLISRVLEGEMKRERKHGAFGANK